MFKSGFIVALALTAAIGGSTAAPQIAHADAKGINISQHCVATHGHGWAQLLHSNSAAGWLCQRGQDFKSVNMTKACIQQHGRGYVARNETGGAYDWECIAEKRGVNVGAYCRKTHGKSAYQYKVSELSGGWQCRVPSKGGKVEVGQYGVDMTRACRRQHGPEFRAYNTEGGIYTWYCSPGS